MLVISPVKEAERSSRPKLFYPARATLHFGPDDSADMKASSQSHEKYYQVGPRRNFFIPMSQGIRVPQFTDGKKLIMAGTLTEAECDELESLKRRADKHAHGHIIHALRLQLMDDVATFITAIGGAIIMAASALLLGSENSNKTPEIVVATVASLITLVSVWQAIRQPGLRSKRHQFWGSKFAEIENECRLILSDRSEETVPSLMSRMTALSNEIDLVPERRWRQVKTKRQSET